MRIKGARPLCFRLKQSLRVVCRWPRGPSSGASGHAYRGRCRRTLKDRRGNGRQRCFGQANLGARECRGVAFRRRAISPASAQLHRDEFRCRAPRASFACPQFAFPIFPRLADSHGAACFALLFESRSGLFDKTESRNQRIAVRDWLTPLFIGAS